MSVSEILQVPGVAYVIIGMLIIAFLLGIIARYHNERNTSKKNFQSILDALIWTLGNISRHDD